MISTENLEMIPPIPVRERTFGWYPPAHEQFAKVPYKSLAVLEDYLYFKSHEKNNEEEIDDKLMIKDNEPSVDNNGSILSSKLNAIRQDLTRRRIDPTVIRKVHSKKFNSLNNYMNIPENWKAKYPEPNFEDLNSIEHRHSAPATREGRQSLFEKEKFNSKQAVKKNEENLVNNQLENSNLDSSKIVDFNEFNLMKQRRSNLQRPHTAPGIPLKVSKSKNGSFSSFQCRQSSAGTSTKDDRFNQKQSFKSKRLTQSTLNIPNASTYDEDLVKYKWMMEVPGDPFTIKQPHIPAKQPYFQKIEDCKILPPELRMSKQNRDTFFYNTIPYQSTTFDISPNFTSEKYNAKKNLLRSQGKWNFSSKNFSFVY